MMRKDKLLLPMTLAAALAAAPVLAQSPAAQGGATANPSAAGADTRPSTAQGTTGTTTMGTTGTGATGSTTMGTTTMGTTATMQELAANSVIRHRPRLSQLIGSNIYNEQNETIGEVDDVILAASTGTMGSPGAGMTGTATTPGTTTGTTTGGAATGTTMSGMAAGTMAGPVVVIQVGGFLGIGGRLVTVPLSELQWNAERERVIMPNASKESLQGRPAFTYDALRRG
jgi:hypothetical protein